MRVLSAVARAAKAFGMTFSAAPRWPWLAGEPFTGAWQKNITLDSDPALLRNSAVYACVTGIATDVAKCRIKLDRNDSGIWREVTSGQPWLPVLRKPNHYQNRIKFIEQWMLSKLLQGNAFVLKQRDGRSVVNALYVLDPRRVTPLVAQDGGVYYQVAQDPLSQVAETGVVVPASEIIHDMMPALWHPLVGVPPLYACAMSATVGNRIENHSGKFFENLSLPGGILTAPGHIDDETANRLKSDFEKKYGGQNLGRLFVAGDGLEFKPMQMTAEASQLAEQFKMSVEDIARAFHYPIFKLGGPIPPYAGNVEAMIVSYYTDCLQSLIESLELSLDEGLSLPADLGTELDLDNLMRMDTAALYESNNKAVGGGWMAPDEARYRANYSPVAGGSTPYLQQQNYSLAALAKRDARPDPFAKEPSGRAPEPGPPGPPARRLSPERLRSFAAGRLRRERAA